MTRAEELQNKIVIESQYRDQIISDLKKELYFEQNMPKYSFGDVVEYRGVKWELRHEPIIDKIKCDYKYFLTRPLRGRQLQHISVYEQELKL